jgi:predicted nucleic acid-binding Zn ribbon protein
VAYGDSYQDHDEEDEDDPENPDESDIDEDDDEGPDLVECPRCGAEISEDAQRCPRCGSYLSQEDTRPRKPPWMLITAVVLVVAILVSWVLLAS